MTVCIFGHLMTYTPGAKHAVEVFHDPKGLRVLHGHEEAGLYEGREVILDFL
jgi:hypothetical protein